MSIFKPSEIGGWIKERQRYIVVALSFVLVVFIAFGMGRLSAPPIVRNPIVFNESGATSSLDIFSDVSQPDNIKVGEALQTGSSQGLFVASKNSKVYHWPWCAAAKKIKPENQIWFKNEAEAKAAGYLPSSCVIPEAPAGYVSK